MTRKSPAIDLRSVRYLIAVADEGTFAAAAAKLRITQPALSRSVQALERTLGVKLFDRGKSGATPTAFGRLLITRGRALILDAAAIEREVALIAGAETGEITIGAGTYPAEICVGAAAARVLAKKPGLSLRIVVGDWPDLTESVLSERIDLAICDVEIAETDPRLSVEMLPQHQGVLFSRADHPLARRRAVTVDEVARFPIALTALPERLERRLLPTATRERGIAVPPVHVDTFQLARAIVLQSDTIGAAVMVQIADDVHAGRVVVLPIDLPWFCTRYGFIHLAGRTLAPSLELFMNEIRAIESGSESRQGTTGGATRPRRERAPKHSR